MRSWTHNAKTFRDLVAKSLKPDISQDLRISLEEQKRDCINVAKKLMDAHPTVFPVSASPADAASLRQLIEELPTLTETSRLFDTLLYRLNQLKPDYAALYQRFSDLEIAAEYLK